jgi:type IV pilus assembly protein PilE
MRNSKGFTLIELMVVVIVIAILAAIALPSYLNQTRKSRRNAAEAAIQQIALLEERYRADNTEYLAAPAPNSTGWTKLGSYPGGSYYSYAVTIAAATSTVPATYTITATGKGMQLKDKANGTSCVNLYFVPNQDSAVDTACSLTGTNVTANGRVTACPLDCWNRK